MINFRHNGSFSNTDKFFENLINNSRNIDFDKFGREGVNALASYTPVDSGITAESWYYEVVKDKDGVSIQFLNTNIQNGVPIAIIIQYGHATKSGGWVQGRDYINPAIQPIFDKLAKQVQREVSKS